jgi:hypothetical protein
MDKTSVKKSANKWHNNLIPWAKDPRTITNESKSAWRDRRRNAMKMMDLLLEYQSMTKDELQNLASNPNSTMLELLMVKYITWWMKDTRLLVDYMDRHVPKAPQKMELTWEDWWAIQIDYSKLTNEQLQEEMNKLLSPWK